jgi:hypothetical protein
MVNSVLDILDLEGPLTEDDQGGLYSPIPEHFPKKVDMNNSHVDYKEFLPSLDLKKKIGNNNNSSAIKIQHIDEKDKRSALTMYFETKEWQEILKIVSLTQDDVNRLMKNKVVSKLINAFEILSKLFTEKNIQIKALETDMESFKGKVSELTSENLLLTKNCNQLLQQSTELKHHNQNYIAQKENGSSHAQDLDESLVGNASKLTIHYLNSTINDTEFKQGYDKNIT